MPASDGKKPKKQPPSKRSTLPDDAPQQRKAQQPTADRSKFEIPKDILTALGTDAKSCAQVVNAFGPQTLVALRNAQNDTERLKHIQIFLLAVRSPKTSDKIVTAEAKKFLSLLKFDDFFWTGPHVKFMLSENLFVKLLCNPKFQETFEQDLKKRHIVPKCYNSEQIKLYAAAMRDGKRVLLLNGTSGGGKTYGGIATTYALSQLIGVEGVCAFFTSDQLSLTAGLFEETNSDLTAEQKLVADRDLCRAVCDLVVNRCVVNKTRPGAMNADQQPHLVVVIDELGANPQVVRSLCRCHTNLVQDIRAACNLPDDWPVYVVGAGTGVAGGTHTPGTKPDSYALMHVSPFVWGDMQNQVPPRVWSEVNARNHPVSAHAYDLVQNARAANFFVQEVQQFRAQADVTPLRVIEVGCMKAAASYLSANGMCKLKLPQYCTAVLKAASLQTATQLDEEETLKFVHKYGLLTDRAKTACLSDIPRSSLLLHQQDSEHGLFLETDYNGIRYELHPAHTAMLLAVLGFADRQDTPHAFEVTGAQFIAFAFQWSRPDFDFNFDEVGVDALPGWNIPLYLVSRLKDALVNNPAQKKLEWSSDTIFDEIRIRQAKIQIESRTRADGKTLTSFLSATASAPRKGDRTPRPSRVVAVLKEMVQHAVSPAPQRESKQWRPVAVTVNGGTASYADIVAVGCGVVLLGQAKCLKVTKLTSMATFNELYKMGHRDVKCKLAWSFVNFPKVKSDLTNTLKEFHAIVSLHRSYAAAGAAANADDDSAAVADVVVVDDDDDDEDSEVESVSFTEKKQLKKGFDLLLAYATDDEWKRIDRALPAAYQAPNQVTQALSDAKGITKVLYVVMVCAEKSPDPIPCVLPDDVVLLYAPYSERDCAPLRRAAARLELFYPFGLQQAENEFDAGLKPSLFPSLVWLAKSKEDSARAP